MPRPPRSTLFPYTTLFRSILHRRSPTIRLRRRSQWSSIQTATLTVRLGITTGVIASVARSEEHTSELQSLRHLVCRLLLEKKKNNNQHAQSEQLNSTMTHH